MEAVIGIRMEPAIAIPHRRNIAFDNGADPDSGEFPEETAHGRSEARSRSRAHRPRSRMLTGRMALNSLSAPADS
jgi:hypothetical protein